MTTIHAIYGITTSGTLERTVRHHVSHPLSLQEIPTLLHTVQELIDAGADVNVTNGYRNTPLHKACYYGQTAVALFLLEHGAEVTANIVNETPLHYAAAHRDPVITRLLLEKGADVNAQADNGDTPLHYACRNSRIETVRLLLEHGADVNARDRKGRTPRDLVMDMPHNDPAREEILDLVRE